jgi:hypothetical protein
MIRSLPRTTIKNNNTTVIIGTKLTGPTGSVN